MTRVTENMPSMKAPNNPEKVALLKGGWNSERDVSLNSAKGILPALITCGFKVLEIDVTGNIQSLIQKLADFSPDVVFLNALHGRYVEDGIMQGLMEMLGYPYTGSDVLSSAIAFDKAQSRSLFEAHGVQIPWGKCFVAKEFFAQAEPEVNYPFVTKPLNEGSSVGVSLIHTRADFKRAAEMWSFGDSVLVEDYIAGRELSVALQNDKALGILELRPKEGFYDYAAKYTEGLTDHVMPAKLPAEDDDLVREMAQKAVRALGVSGVSRADIRYDETRPSGSRAFILEINTLPGMTPLSIVPEIAAHAGLTYEQLCNWMVKNPIWPQEKSLLKERPKDDEKPPLHKVLS